MLTEVLRLLEAASIPVETVSLTSSGTIEIIYSPSATQEQRDAGDAIAAAYDAPLADARQKRLADLDAWYATQVSSGVTVSGIKLKATIESQNRFDALATTLLAGLQVGQITGSTEWMLYDYDGNEVTMTVTQILTLLLGYAQELQTLAGGYSACEAAIRAAQTVGEVEAVPLPS